MHTKIAIIGLGYVGIPLAVEFGKKYRTIGYDKNIDRINTKHKLALSHRFCNGGDISYE